MNRRALLLASLGACAAASPAIAQTGQAPAEDDGDTIVVTASGRPEGSVIGTIAPEVTLTPGDIRSFGVSSLSDLIAELSPQLASGQGRGGENPVVLLGGKRISGFAEIRNIPTEAIQRVEILPEEVALKYGYRANQKVVNVVLRRRFNAFTAELEAGAPTAGGQFSPQVETSYFRNGAAGRLNLALEYEHSSALTEAERGIRAETPRRPFDIVGNVTSAIPGAEIDPALSALLGAPATVAGVPATAAGGRPALADFSGTANLSDIGRYRTLLPETDALTLNAVLARTIFGNVSAAFNGSFTYNASDSMQGLAGARIALPAANPFSPFAGDTLLYRYLNEFGALSQESRDTSGHLGTTLNGALGRWQWSFTGTFDHGDSRTVAATGFDLAAFQDRVDAGDPLTNPFAPLSRDRIGGDLFNRAHSTSDVGEAELLATGSPFALPAGAATTTITLGGTVTGFRSRSTRAGIASSADLSRRELVGQISLDLPLASRKRGFLAPLGELSANLNLGYEELSDFGGLRNWGAGLNWTPIRPVSIIVSLSKDEGAPTVQQLGNPLVATNGVRVFDYVRGETIDIVRLAGGNPALSADDRRVFKLGMTLKPFTKTDLTLTANYTDSRVHNPIAAFPTATAAIEAAFPDRFTRDASGRLVQIDSRPINFERRDSRELRWGINFSKQLSAPPRRADGGAREGQQPSLRELLPPGPGDRPAQDRRAASERPGAGGPGGSRGGFGGGFGRGPGGRGTRLQLAVYHTLHLREQILVHEGGPLLDLLDGDAIASSGGVPRHEVQAQAGLMHEGFGVRLSASWQSGTTVAGGTTGAQTLHFSDLATLNLRLFANLGQQRSLVSKWPFLRGTRLSLAVTNLFDQRLRVTDATGATPISYQPAYLDPLGRSIRISFRKLFFSGGPR